MTEIDLQDDTSHFFGQAPPVDTYYNETSDGNWLPITYDDPGEIDSDADVVRVDVIARYDPGFSARKLNALDLPRWYFVGALLALVFGTVIVLFVLLTVVGAVVSSGGTGGTNPILAVVSIVAGSFMVYEALSLLWMVHRLRASAEVTVVSVVDGQLMEGH